MSYNAYLILPGSGLHDRQIVGGAETRSAARSQVICAGYALSNFRIEWAGEGPEPVPVEETPQVSTPAANEPTTTESAKNDTHPADTSTTAAGE